jgi:hypothetical protein
MVVFGLVGVFLIKAAVDYSPNKAVGLDGALGKIAHASHGPFLLGIVAAGLIGWVLAEARGTAVSSARRRASDLPMNAQPVELAAMRKARSLLLILLATCRETQLALDAAANALDSDLTTDLEKMIERTEGELHVLTDKINAAT